MVESLNFNSYDIKSNTMLIPFLYNCRSLQYGNQFIYQSMPRMLSLWLDFGAKAYECEKGMIFLIKNFKGLRRIVIYMWVRNQVLKKRRKTKQRLFKVVAVAKPCSFLGQPNTYWKILV